MRSNGPLANKKWPWVAMGGPVLRSGRKWPFGPPHEPTASIRPRLPKKLEPCGWMPFLGLPDGPSRWGIVQRQNRGL